MIVFSKTSDIQEFTVESPFVTAIHTDSAWTFERITVTHIGQTSFQGNMYDAPYSANLAWNGCFFSCLPRCFSRNKRAMLMPPPEWSSSQWTHCFANVCSTGCYKNVMGHGGSAWQHFVLSGDLITVCFGSTMHGRNFEEVSFLVSHFNQLFNYARRQVHSGSCKSLFFKFIRSADSGFPCIKVTLRAPESGILWNWKTWL